MSSEKKGSDVQFMTILNALNEYNQKYMTKALSFIKHADHVDGLFNGEPHGWSKSAWHAELERRTGSSKKSEAKA